MMEWILSGAVLFWILMLAVYSRRWKCEKREWDRNMEAVKERMDTLRHARNVSDARLSMIRHITDQALREAKGPYRSWAINPIEVFAKIGELVDESMAENCREVGHFRDLQEAMEFLNTLPQESNAYVFPCRMWDGDCHHVVYSVPAPTEIPPDGADVRK
jgi:hypothetical protein